MECEENRDDEFHVAEVLYYYDVYLKVFYNGNCENDYVPPGQYGCMYYWQGMHARNSFLIGDDNDEYDVAASSWYGANVLMRNKSTISQLIIMRYRELTFVIMQFRLTSLILIRLRPCTLMRS